MTKPKWMTLYYFTPRIGCWYSASPGSDYKDLLCVAVSDSGRRASFTEKVDTRRSGSRCRFYSWEFSTYENRLAWVETDSERGSRLRS